jgi:hypothetical protein
LSWLAGVVAVLMLAQVAGLAAFCLLLDMWSLLVLQLLLLLVLVDPLQQFLPEGRV